MTPWEKAIAFVLRMEGGLTKDPDDPGGLTNFGISQKAYPNLDILNLTIDHAKDIYHKDYWLPCSCDSFPPAVAISLFDCAVNQGTGRAIRLLQLGLGIEPDGIVGSQTISTAFKSGRDGVKHFLGRRLAEYTRLITANPKLMVFAYNWSYRVIALADLVLKEE